MIPDRLSTIAEARAAIAAYDAARNAPKPEPQALPQGRADELHRAMGWGPMGKSAEAASTYARLDRVPGPGPVVTVAQNGSERVLGRADAQRGSYRVDLPEITPYGPVVAGLPVDALESLVVDRGLVLALAARLEACAEVAPARAAGYQRAEAAQLLDLGHELEVAVPPLGAPFLDHWRACAARWSPEPTRPTYRPAQIRR